jgi:hypothetical protein
MDVTFARALQRGAEAVHTADPEADAAIEGGQIPGWGGYDYARLAQAVDVMEMTDDLGSFDVARLVNPRLKILTTSFERAGNIEEYRVWRELLRGNHGLILWDPDGGFIDADGRVGRRGKDAGYLREITGGLGALLVNSVRRSDPVAILSSPASMRLQWLNDRKRDQQPWSERDADAEDQDNNDLRNATRGVARLIESLGLQPRFVPSSLLEEGELERGKDRVLVLPHAIAISSQEVAAIRRFLEAGGRVIADCPPGIFDQHGRKRAALPLPEIGVAPPDQGTGSTAASGCDGRIAARVVAALQGAGIAPAYVLTKPDGEPARDLSLTVFENGAARIVAVHRIRSTPASADGEMATGDSDVSTSVSLALPRASFVYDLRTCAALGRVDRVGLELDAAAPAVLAISDAPIPPPTISGPAQLRQGEIAALRLGLAGVSAAAVHVFHVDVVDPAGKVVRHYSGNALAPRGAATWLFPVALNDAIGMWQVRARDVLSGQAATAMIEVKSE